MERVVDDIPREMAGRKRRETLQGIWGREFLNLGTPSMIMWGEDRTEM